MPLQDPLDQYLQRFEAVSRTDPIVATAMRLIDHTCLQEVDALKVCIVELVRLKDSLMRDSLIQSQNRTIILMREAGDIYATHK